MRVPRLVTVAVVLALGGIVAGCGSTTGWDPTDLLDVFDTKKKLPGDRKPVFPEGVPGVEQGVPKNLYRGANVEPQPEVAPPEPPPANPPRTSRGAKQRRAAPAVAPADVNVPDVDTPVEEGSTTAAPPAPKPMKPSRRRITTPPPDQPAQTQSPSAAPQTSSAPFPAPLPSGGFSR